MASLENGYVAFYNDQLKLLDNHISVLQYDTKSCQFTTLCVFDLYKLFTLKDFAQKSSSISVDNFLNRT